MSADFTKYLATLPSDHFAKINLFTNVARHDEYDFIRPEDPRLSQKDKVVVVTGASAGIGRKGLAPAFARAGAKAIYLVARNQAELQAAKKELEGINPDVKVHTKVMSVSDEMAAQELFKEIESEYGKAHVLLNNAGCGKGGPVVNGASVEGIWTDFEVMVKGIIIISQYFAKTLGKTEKGHIINITSAAGPFFLPGTDSYGLCKLVQVQIQRYIATGSPNIHATSLQPGAVLTGITKPGFERFSVDSPRLSGATAVWLTSSEADFLSSRYVDATWDMTELVERKEEITRDNLLVMELKGDFTKGRA
ncbi:NAD(P)-binding protein [Pleurostoma richardsiae]|uniref:NAD(P)-binding protein n=1 Tax=Pleurostoma richardsiae TaxID=41990 RepID=A0AA38RCN9_9PEZI|nr:NAD(P)-binding protein [Pleurostoma richardsiae]